MTSQDLQDLREMQADLVAAEKSPWQPGCVAWAFSSERRQSPFVLTMQAWIDLDAMESPFLHGKLPDAETALRDFRNAFLAFGYVATTPENCDPEGLILIGRKIIETILAAFAMQVKLAPPEGFQLSKNENGFGDWLPIVACLKSQLGFSLGEALALPVEQAFALVSAHRGNEGWAVASETYAQRDVPDEEAK